MRNLIIILGALAANAASANFEVSAMPAGALADILRQQSAFSLPACRLSASLISGEGDSPRVLFSLSSPRGSANLAMSLDEPLTYTYDTESGEQDVNGRGLSIQSIDWHTVKAITLNSFHCSPQ